MMDGIIDGALESSSGLSIAELTELLEIFCLVDLDHGGTISKEELGRLMQTLGIRSSKVELEVMINEIDVEGKGEIDFKSFVCAMSRKVQTKISMSDLKNAFRLISVDDMEQNKCVNISTLMEILINYGDKDKRLTKEEAEDLISSVAPQTERGTFDWGKFVQMYDS